MGGLGIGPNYLPADNANVFKDAADPGTRVGGIGEWTTLGSGWRPASGVGWNGTAGFTTTDPATGDYPRGGLQFLVSPAIDLSAYPIQTGTLPFVSGSYGMNRANS